MAMIVKAKVECWVYLEVDTNDLADAYSETEEKIKNDPSKMQWEKPEVTDVEFVDTAEEETNEDAAYEEFRDRQCGFIA